MYTKQIQNLISSVWLKTSTKRREVACNESLQREKNESVEKNKALAQSALRKRVLRRNVAEKRGCCANHVVHIFVAFVQFANEIRSTEHLHASVARQFVHF